MVEDISQPNAFVSYFDYPSLHLCVSRGARAKILMLKHLLVFQWNLNISLI